MGVSRDSVESHRRFVEELELPFALLSDPDASVHAEYGVLKEKTVDGETTLSTERTTVVIGEDGRVERIYPRVKVDGHVEAVLEDLE